jgi:hypothetical protein
VFDDLSAQAFRGLHGGYWLSPPDDSS